MKSPNGIAAFRDEGFASWELPMAWGGVNAARETDKV
jgi:hypothetical protein